MISVKSVTAILRQRTASSAASPFAETVAQLVNHYSVQTARMIMSTSAQMNIQPKPKVQGICFCSGLTRFYWEGQKGKGWACSKVHAILKYGDDVRMIGYDRLEGRAAQDKAPMGY